MNEITIAREPMEENLNQMAELIADEYEHVGATPEERKAIIAEACWCLICDFVRDLDGMAPERLVAFWEANQRDADINVRNAVRANERAKLRAA